MENTLKKPMTGIIPPLVTPLLDNDKLDIDGLERLIERLIKGASRPGSARIIYTGYHRRSAEYQLPASP